MQAIQYTDEEGKRRLDLSLIIAKAEDELKQKLDERAAKAEENGGKEIARIPITRRVPTRAAAKRLRAGRRPGGR